MSTVNEELVRVPNIDVDKDAIAEPVVAMNPDFAAAIDEHEKIKDKLEDDFKDKEKEKEDFIKDTERREIKFSAPKQIKQMKLSESLFEDYDDNPNMFDKIFLSLDNIQHLVNATMDWSDEDWTIDNCKQTTEMLEEEIKTLRSRVTELDRENNESALKEEVKVESPTVDDEEVIVSTTESTTEPLTEAVDELKGYSIEKQNNFYKVLDDNGVALDIDFESEDAAKEYINTISDDDTSELTELLDFNVPVTASVTANGNTVPFLNGTSKTEEFDSDDYDSDDLSDEELYELIYAGNANGITTEDENQDDLINNDLAEAAGVLDREESVIVYKKKRPPLANIIMAELSEGEVVYRKSPDGKLTPTNGPHLNIDYENVGANADDKGEYIIAWVEDEEQAAEVKAIGDKYNKEVVIGEDSHVARTPYFVKIYITEADWDEPYVDPSVETR